MSVVLHFIEEAGQNLYYAFAQQQITGQLTMVLFSVSDVCDRGLRFAKIKVIQRWLQQRKLEEFHALYGQDPLVLATQWYDLSTTDCLPDDLCLSQKEKDGCGLKMFMAAHFYLWQYPKNTKTFAGQFNMCDSYAKGKHLWTWIERIAGLKAIKIFWPQHLNNADSEIVIVTIDGTDKATWEKKHPTLPYDKGTYTQKKNHG